MPYELPKLPYAYDALEPWIDAKTMEIHHAKHHQAYTDNVNKALAGTAWEKKPIEEALRNLQEIPEDKRGAVRNHGGGYYNHALFWTFMAPGKGGKPAGELLKAIEAKFSTFEDFQQKFEAAALGQFGSGWAWLIVDGGDIDLVTTANQDSPISQGKTSIFGVDVWEHAYYLKYQNKRVDYLKAFWNTVNWDEVARRFQESA